MKVIAEVGSNIKNLDDCFYSIEKAKAAGANAVKFQYFTSEDMYGFPGRLEPFFHQQDIPKLKACADKVGIEFMCTVFSPEMLIYLLPMIDTIKIASSDMEYMEMIDLAIKSEKDLYLSTGGHNQAEIQRIVKYISEQTDYMTLFYCESEYPTYKTDFRKLSLDPFLTYDRIGLSDHSKEVYSTIIEARDYGIAVIEKHVNFCHYKDTPDAAHSLGFSDFELMVKAIRGELPKDMLSPGERDMRLRHNRRLVVLKPIKAGEDFVYGKNFGCYRSLVDSLDHTSPFNYDKIDSTRALRDYKVGDII